MIKDMRKTAVFRQYELLRRNDMFQKGGGLFRFTAVLLLISLLALALSAAFGESDPEGAGVSAEGELLKWAVEFGLAEVEEDEAGQPVRVNGYPVCRTTASFSNRDSQTIFEYDTWFQEYPFWLPATSYDANLASMSLNMALSADRSKGHGPAEINYNPSEGIEKYLAGAGFTNIRKDDYNKIPSQYTVSSAIGSRVMESEGEEPFTLVAVAVCGANYQGEWVSNVTVGTGDLHEGFRYAAGLIVDRIAGYISTCGIRGRVKVWMSGFSRSAAISNITGALITDSGMLPKEDVFVYTFATPAGVKNPPVEGHENIFSILGATDLVPQLLPVEWGFGRYGTDIVLPAIENSSYLGTIVTKMRAQSTDMEFATHNDYNPAMNLRVRLLVSMLLQGVGSREDYCSYLQSALQSMMENKSPANMIVNMRRIMLGAGKDGTAEMDALMDYIFRLVSSSAFRQEYAQLGQKNGNMLFRLANEHFEDSYLGSMIVLRLGGEKTSENFCYVMARGDVSLDVTDLDLGIDVITLKSSGDVEYHTDYVPENEYDPELYYTERIGNVSVMAIPMDENYRVTWTAEKDGEAEFLWARCSDAMTTVYSGAGTGPVRVKAGDTGTAFLTEGQQPVLSTGFQETTLNGREMAAFLGIHTTGLNWRLLISLAAALLGAVISIPLCVYFSRKPERRGRGFLYWLTAALLGIAALEAEAAFWLFADMAILRFIWKLIFSLCLLALYFQTGRRQGSLSGLWLIGLMLAIGADLTLTFHSIAGTALFVAFCLYLAVCFLRKKGMPGRQWVLWAVCSFLSSGMVLMYFRASSGSVAWLAAAGGPIALLALFASGSQPFRIRLSTGLFVVSVLFLAFYNVTEKDPLLHVAYAGLFACAMILFAARGEDGAAGDSAVRGG